MTVYNNKEESPSTVAAPPDQSQQLLDHLIATKEKDLECRLEYTDKEVFRRQRYAERMAEELDMLRKERTKQYKR